MTTEIAIDVWNRQCRMLDSYANLVTEANKHLSANDQAMPLGKQLAHVQLVRYDWLGSVAPDLQEPLDYCFREVDGNWFPLDDLDEVRRQLKLSAAAVKEAYLRGERENQVPFGPYDHPYIFLQHMLWHEGWHVGQISLALRVHGLDPGDAWEEEHVWELWRGKEG